MKGAGSFYETIAESLAVYEVAAVITQFFPQAGYARIDCPVADIGIVFPDFLDRKSVV